MRIRQRYDHWIPRLLRVEAIVLYPYMLFSSKQGAVDARTLRHEWQHVHQINFVGVWRFYLSYILFYIAFRVAGESDYIAYSRIPWEEEARAAE
ncbi:MAG: hypothetical protein HC883_00045 [Bdellovibrionaceae bacterium]|nr:hypothetical protein [Pseudobdellovibrionaceae bacterium]